MADLGFQVGQSVRVVDASAPRSGKRLPFKQGALLTVKHATARHYLQLVEHPGLWAAHRFAPDA